MGAVAFNESGARRHWVLALRRKRAGRGVGGAETGDPGLRGCGPGGGGARSPTTCSRPPHRAARRRRVRSAPCSSAGSPARRGSAGLTRSRPCSAPSPPTSARARASFARSPRRRSTGSASPSIAGRPRPPPMEEATADRPDAPQPRPRQSRPNPSRAGTAARDRRRGRRLGVDQLGAGGPARQLPRGQRCRRLAAQHRGRGERGDPGVLCRVRRRAGPRPGHGHFPLSKATPALYARACPEKKARVYR